MSTEARLTRLGLGHLINAPDEVVLKALEAKQAEIEERLRPHEEAWAKRRQEIRAQREGKGSEEPR